MSGERCLVLGGAGFMGSPLVDLLARSGFRVRVFDLPGCGSSSPAQLSEIEFVPGDFVRDKLDAVVAGCEYVFHLIGTTVPTSSNRSPVFDVESNVVGSLRLLEACVRARVRKVVFASSGGTVYGEPQSESIPETHSTEPRSSYGITKLTVEKYLALFHHLHKLDYTVLRMGNVYGPRLPVKGEQGVVGFFLARLKHGQPLVVYGDGQVARDYVYVEDVARALRAAMAQTSPFRVFNIGSGVGTTLNEMVDWLEKVSGRSAQVLREPGRPSDVRANVLDVSRAREHLNWQPSVSLEDGLRRTWKWILDQEQI